MNELFLFVRPPRPLWPFNSPASAFWPPLAFASMAAMLRERLRDLRVEILDAPALEMGWRTLAAEIQRRRPAFVGIGEEAVSCVEGLAPGPPGQGLRRQGDCRRMLLRTRRAAGAGDRPARRGRARRRRSDARRAGPGAARRFARRPGEGEWAFRSWPGSNLRAQRRSSAGEVVTTPPRQLVPDLDTLPLPAYDLLPVERYGARSVNHPRLAAIELGRGCFGSCDFCVLWRQMGRFAGDRLVPQLRVKSPERLLEEIRLLVRRYHRRYLGWVDPCFNADPRVPGQLAELLLRDGIRVGQSAWVRTDAMVRDAHSGALANCVRSGLNEVYLGIERPDSESLSSLHKTSGVADAREALRILREQFPEVLAIGSFIYGLPGDSPRTIRAIHRFVSELELDQFFFIPLTPLPGTAEWRPELWDPTGERFREFNFLPTGRPHGRHAELERALLWSLLTNWPWARVRSYLRHLASAATSAGAACNGGWRPEARAFICAGLLHNALGGGDEFGMVFPRWYES